MTHDEYIKTCKESGMAINYHEDEGCCEIFFENIKNKAQQRAVIHKLNEYIKQFKKI